MVWECPREGRTYRGYEIGIAKAFFVGYAFVACRRLYAGRRRTLLLASSAFMSALALRRSFSTAQMASRRTGQRERTDSVHCYALCATNRSAADWEQRRVTQFWVGSLWCIKQKVWVGFIGNRLRKPHFVSSCQNRVPRGTRVRLRWRLQTRPRLWPMHRRQFRGTCSVAGSLRGRRSWLAPNGDHAFLVRTAPMRWPTIASSPGCNIHTPTTSVFASAGIPWLGFCPGFGFSSIEGFPLRKPRRSGQW